MKCLIGTVCLLRSDIGHPIAEQRPDVLLAAPQRRRLRTGRRRRGVRLHGGEQLPDESLRRPVEQADGAAGAADPDQLVGAGLVMRREHHPDAGQHGVEVLVRERQCLRVAPPPSTIRRRARAACARPRSKSSGVRSEAMTSAPASAAGMAAFPDPAADVQHPRPAADPARLDQHRSEAGDQIRCQCLGSRRTPTSPDAWPSGRGRRRPRWLLPSCSLISSGAAGGYSTGDVVVDVPDGRKIDRAEIPRARVIRGRAGRPIRRSTRSRPGSAAGRPRPCAGPTRSGRACDRSSAGDVRRCAGSATSAAAMSRLSCPAATSRSTSRSRAVSASSGVGASGVRRRRRLAIGREELGDLPQEHRPGRFVGQQDVVVALQGDQPCARNSRGQQAAIREFDHLVSPGVHHQGRQVEVGEQVRHVDIPALTPELDRVLGGGGTSASGRRPRSSARESHRASACR